MCARERYQIFEKNRAQLNLHTFVFLRRAAFQEKRSIKQLLPGASARSRRWGVYHGKTINWWNLFAERGLTSGTHQTFALVNNSGHDLQHTSTGM